MAAWPVATGLLCHEFGTLACNRLLPCLPAPAPQIKVVKQQPAEKVASLLSVLFRWAG